MENICSCAYRSPIPHCSNPGTPAMLALRLALLLGSEPCAKPSSLSFLRFRVLIQEFRVTLLIPNFRSAFPYYSLDAWRPAEYRPKEQPITIPRWRNRHAQNQLVQTLLVRSGHIATHFDNLVGELDTLRVQFYSWICKEPVIWMDIEIPSS